MNPIKNPVAWIACIIAFFCSSSPLLAQNNSGITQVQKAAEQGDADAQYSLGYMYDWGNGVSRDDAKAVEWYRKAADQGNIKAQCRLGGIYELGLGVPKDDAKAVEWYKKAAEKGDLLAQVSLGSNYEQGKGVPKNDVAAHWWYRKAAEQGDSTAQFKLGCLYAEGRGVTKDYAKAVDWLRKAAEQDHADAQCGLGYMYAKGEGVPRNNIEAYKWLSLSAAHGNALAKESLSRINQNMTRGEIAEAQRLTQAFKPCPASQPEEPSFPSTVSNPAPSAAGSGFFVTIDGFFVTNAHVVNGGSKFKLLTSDGLVSARVVKVDDENDIAVLKAEGNYTPLPIIASRSVRLGNTVATVGFPNITLQGFAPKLAKGEIAALSGMQDNSHYFQISVPVQPGNSGGALVDEKGNVVGIVSAKLSAKAALRENGTIPENVNYAVKSGFLLSFLESLPEVIAKLKEPNTNQTKFEDVVKSAEQAAALILIYY